MNAADHRFLRNRLGLTVGAEARLFGIGRRTIERWESGDVPVQPVALRLLRLLELEHATGTPRGVRDALELLAAVDYE